MTEENKRSFLQETAFEEDVDLDSKPEKKDISKKEEILRRYWAKSAGD